MKTPLFVSAAALMASLTLSLLFDLTPLLIAVGCLPAAAAVFCLLRFGKKPLFALALAVLVLGFAYGEFREAITAADPFAGLETASLGGRVADDPSPRERSLRFRFRVEDVNGEALIHPVDVIAVTEKDADVGYGDRLVLDGSFLSSETLNPGSFDFETYHRQSRLYGVFSALYGGGVTVAERGGGQPLLRLAYALKHRFERSLSYLPQEQAALIRGVFFGDTSGLSHGVNSVLSQSGIRHCFAVSGLHVGYAALFLGALGALLRLGSKGKTALTAVCLLLYAAMTGFSPSVVRAAVMCLMVAGAVLLGRERNAFNGLGLAAILLLLWDPLTLTRPGFQLSFLAIFSILILVPWLKQRVPWSFPGRDALFVTLAAQIGLIPMLAYYFHVVSFVAVLLGSFCCLIVGAMVALCFTALILCLVAPILGALALIPCGLLGSFILTVATLGARLPFAYLYKGDFGLVWLLAVYAAVALIVFLPAVRERRFFSLAAMTAVFVLFSLPLSFGGGSGLEVTFLSVGEGDAIYIRTPDGSDYLMDACDRRGGGETYYTLRPFLLSRGVDDIETVFLSHNDDDHSGALPYLAADFELEALCFPAAAEGRFADKIAVAEGEDAAVATVKSGDVLDLGGGVRLEILWPDADSEGEDNDLSLVARLTYGDFSVLFTGDVEGSGLAALDAMAKENAGLDADVLKIPHHGSKNSFDPAFYEAVDAEAAVISVGKNNYGHPDDDVVSYWRERKIPCYRTDLDGAVTVFSDGGGYEITTFRQSGG